MSDYADIVREFLQVAALARIPIKDSEIEIQFAPAPHDPPAFLPKGKFAVYVFMFGDRCLKVGKAGSKSAARFCSQHYGANRAPSTLAKSLINAQIAGDKTVLDANNVSGWMRSNTSRINFLLPSSFGPTALSLLEVFVQCRLKPEFEGFASQRV